MKTISNKFKVQDEVKCTEDIHSTVYNLTFREGHLFYILGMEKSGLVIEDEDGFLLKNVGFERFEVTHARGDYLQNNNSGWYSNRRNHNHPNNRYMRH